MRHDPDLEIWLSGLGRRALVRAAGGPDDVPGLSPRGADRIAAGLFALYLVATRGTPPPPGFAAEVSAWRSAGGTPQGAEILESVHQDLHRQFANAFTVRGRFGDGAYTAPTALGGRLSALDDYAESRYGCDTGTLWSRVWWVLPKEARAEVVEAKLALETLLNAMLASLLAVPVLLVVALVRRSGMAPALAPPLPHGALQLVFALVAALVLARACYFGAGVAMQSLAEKMRSLIDTYRLEMLAQLGFAPATVAEELALHRELKGFFVQKGPLRGRRRLRSAP